MSRCMYEVPTYLEFVKILYFNLDKRYFNLAKEEYLHSLALSNLSLCATFYDHLDLEGCDQCLQIWLVYFSSLNFAAVTILALKPVRPCHTE